MNGRQLQLWNAQERLLSTAAVVVFTAIGIVGIAAVVIGDLALLAVDVGTFGTVIGMADVFRCDWLARIDERYATSPFVERRLHRRGRRRVFIRGLLPNATIVARTTKWLMAATLLLILGASSAIGKPARHPDALLGATC